MESFPVGIGKSLAKSCWPEDATSSGAACVIGKRHMFGFPHLVLN